MKKRLPLEKNEIIAKLNILGIEIALDLKWSPTSIVPLSVHFPHIIPQNKLNELDDQWRAFHISAKELAVSSKCVPEYWHNLGLVKDGLDQACTTYGPQMHFVQPAKAFQSRSTNEVCLPSVFRVLCVIESTLNKSFPSIVT